MASASSSSSSSSSSRLDFTGRDLYRCVSPQGLFEVMETLGEGSYGAVYRGRHIRTSEIVAIKCIDLIDDEIEEIALEIKILMRCNHANVVKYFGTYLKRENPNYKLWLVMEICEVGSVMDIYKAYGKGLKEDHTSYILFEAMKGLKYMHEHSMIHRDVKAGNILLTRDGGVKLADFGVSAILSSRTLERKTFIGTPYWMAPEVILCDKDENASYGPKCDVWGMGITAIEMSEMDPPLADLHPLRALFLIPNNKPPTFKNPKKWSKNFRDFVKQCLVKDPKKRPSAAELLNHPFFKVDITATKKSKNVLAELIEKRIPDIGLNREEEETQITSPQQLEPEDEHAVAVLKEMQKPSASVRKKTAARSALLHGTQMDLFNAPISVKTFDQPIVPLPKEVARERERKETIVEDTVMSLANGLQNMRSGEFDFQNTAFGQRSDSIVLTSKEERDKIAALAKQPYPYHPTDQDGPSSTPPSSPPNISILAKESHGAVRSSEDEASSSMDAEEGRRSSNNFGDPTIIAGGQLPYKTNRRTGKAAQTPVSSPLPPPPSPLNDLAVASSSSASNSNTGGPRHVRALNLVKDLPFEILCSDTWGSRYLFGTAAGLFQLDRTGKVTRLIKDTHFAQMIVADDYGVLLSICGRHRHIRMYSLVAVTKTVPAGKLHRQHKKDIYTKLSETRGCSHFSVVRAKGTVFLAAAVKRSIILFMWAEYPFNKFMKIKDFYVPEAAIAVEPVVNSEGKVARLLVQTASRFLTIDIETNLPTDLALSANAQMEPLLMKSAPSRSQMFLGFRKAAVFINNDTMQVVGKPLRWSYNPLGVVPLMNDMLLVFTPKFIDVFSTSTTEIIQTIRHKDSRRIRYLLTLGDDVVVATRNPKENNVSNVYIMRAVNTGASASSTASSSLYPPTIHVKEPPAPTKDN